MFDICKQCVNEEFQRTFIIFFMKKFAKRKQRKKIQSYLATAS